MSVSSVYSFLLWTSRLYDLAEEFWHQKSRRLQANFLVITFFSSLILIELSRHEIIPQNWAIPKNHFYAVKLVFDVLLLLEVVGLVFSQAESIANTMGKQLEIFSLILLRQSFKEFVNFAEPIEWEYINRSLIPILSDGFGALLMFGAVTLFYHIQKHRRITENANEQASFVLAKKLLALTLLQTFMLIAIYDLWLLLNKGRVFKLFEVFYTILVFNDILLMLISLRYNSSYGVVFRNSGFALATVLMRLALTAPPIVNVGLGLAAAAMSIGLTLVYNKFEIRS